MKLKIYGSRGTIPYFHRGNTTYGGNTMCVSLEIGEHTVLLDAGSGLLTWAEEQKDSGRTSGIQADILISHLHLDHIAGLPVCSPLWNEGNRIRVFTQSRDARPLREQIFGPFRPPYWPVSIQDLCRAEIMEITDDAFCISKDIRVTTMPLPHSDKTIAFRVEAESKTVVYLLDCEIPPDAEMDESLVRFCRDADLVLFDAGYLPADYPAKRGWGHSTFEAGLHLKDASKCRKMIFAHAAQKYSDTTLDTLARALPDPDCVLAYDGMELEI